MRKHNLFTKKLKKQFLSINDSIESSFDKLKSFKTKLKKTKLSRNSNVFLTLGTIVILTISYSLVPTFYNKAKIQSEIKNHIFKRYDFEIKFNEKIKYALIPTPHFVAKNLSVIHKDKIIAEANELKIFIEINNFFSSNKLNIDFPQGLLVVQDGYNKDKGIDKNQNFKYVSFRDILKKLQL